MSLYTIIAMLQWAISMIEKFMLQYLGWSGWETTAPESESESE
ncbi:MAG TPA: hypothetical protein PKO20_01860 [Clostridiales bacterium]|jgi:hypothetical protein|nr:hypothetical protein [Clostridiales bacterium]HOJ35525.1 hypothetical protein [Clostridiales bacterium]HOL78693.1 hypothetical protein [Clostridiales bacterium]HPP67947.1 hypothetical protein [Clostridiales bacterium]HPU67670.1 hypothetical protein [Clostridiales bacterium]